MVRTPRGSMANAGADVLIVGAGAAGLAAAADLCAAGRTVLLLEARGRTGGRIHTRHAEGLPVAVELGAEFIHGRPREIWDIVDGAALAAYEVDGQSLARERGGRASSGPVQPFDRVLARMKESPGPDRAFQQFLDAADLDAHSKAWAAAYVEGFNAARRERIGVHSLVEDARAAEAIEGHRAFRLPGGYDGVVRRLRAGAPRADLRLNTVVTALEWRRGHAAAEIRTRLGTPLESVTARRALVTVPLGVLQAGAHEPGAIAFRPEPPNLAAAHRLEMGQAMRIALRFRTRFWEERRETEAMGFLHSLDSPVPTWWTAMPLRVPLLTGWAAGPAAVPFAGRGDAFAARSAVESLAGLLDVPAARIEGQLEDWFRHDWQADPYARGAYSYVPAGAMDARAALAASVEDTLFFAGEATDVNGHAATVHGAIASGRRAAARILRS